jgi:hypothetical protein
VSWFKRKPKTIWECDVCGEEVPSQRSPHTMDTCPGRVDCGNEGCFFRETETKHWTCTGGPGNPFPELAEALK